MELENPQHTRGRKRHLIISKNGPKSLKKKFFLKLILPINHLKGKEKLLII